MSGFRIPTKEARFIFYPVSCPCLFLSLCVESCPSLIFVSTCDSVQVPSLSTTLSSPWFPSSTLRANSSQPTGTDTPQVVNSLSDGSLPCMVCVATFYCNFIPFLTAPPCRRRPTDDGPWAVSRSCPSWIETQSKRKPRGIPSSRTAHVL